MMGRPWQRSLLRWLRIAYLAALAAAVPVLVLARREEVTDLLGDLAGARHVLVAASFAAGFVLIALSAYFWLVSLRMLGQRPRFRDLTATAARSLPARYVPLMVTFAISRVALMQRRGVPGGPLALTASLEMAVSLAVSVAYGLVLLGWAGELPGGLAIPFVAAVGVIVAASPSVGGRAVAAVARRRGLDSLASVSGFTWPGYLHMIAASACYWTCAAAVFCLYMRAFDAADGFGTAHLAGAFVLTWGGLRFLSVIAPQGIGVVEVTVPSLLGAADPLALGILIFGFRVVLLLRDLLAAAVSELDASRRTKVEAGPVQRSDGAEP
ncbi:MAG: hypothetical protein F4Z54_07390 [Acidimicrobiaceae bacterium]|nr:hypothetical protein [Acidimicrobiaceae bacterium]MYG78995.1 hypothetical protein [Acidimicrobiaceae bacterium]